MLNLYLKSLTTAIMGLKLFTEVKPNFNQIKKIVKSQLNSQPFYGTVNKRQRPR